MRMPMLVLVACCSIGCIAVESRKTATVSPTPPRSWEVAMEWRCADSGLFDLEHERSLFDRAVESRLADGWELTQFDVVRVPDRDGSRERTCLVGTLRRLRSSEG